MIGFGYTEASDLRFDLSRWVRQCVDLLDALDIERIAVVGNSFGGAVGLRLAIDHPGRVDHLILMGHRPPRSASPKASTRFGVRAFHRGDVSICSVTCSSSTAARSPTTWSKSRYQASIPSRSAGAVCRVVPCSTAAMDRCDVPQPGRAGGARHTDAAGPRPRRQGHPGRQLSKAGRTDPESRPWKSSPNAATGYRSKRPTTSATWYWIRCAATSSPELNRLTQHAGPTASITCRRCGAGSLLSWIRGCQQPRRFRCNTPARSVADCSNSRASACRFSDPCP